MSGLFALFSDESKQKFARAFKPEEHVPVVKPVVKEVDEEQLKIDEAKAEKKQRKKAKRKLAQQGETSIEKSDEVAPTTETKENDDKPIEDFDNHEPISEDTKPRTLFVGNLPITSTKKSTLLLFQPFGAIESIRFRSVPIDGVKVDQAGNQKLVRKVSVNHRKFGEQKSSVNAYIVYKEVESVAQALTLNNSLVGDRHIRVDSATPTLFDNKRTVFIGGLPYYMDEEELRTQFANMLPNKQHDIEGIRIIRDPETLVGKGIGYLMLKDRDSVMAALRLNGSTYKKRWTLRVTTCGKRTKSQMKQQQPKKKEVSNDEEAEGDDGEKEKEDGENDDNDAPKKKMKKDDVVANKNSLNALKRITTKSKPRSSNTKKKVLKARKQTKSKKAFKPKK